jgi:hypothetical protein
MQITVALFNKGGICQEMLASDQMETSEFLYVHDRVIELIRKSSEVTGG